MTCAQVKLATNAAIRSVVRGIVEYTRTVLVVFTSNDGGLCQDPLDQACEANRGEKHGEFRV